MLCDNKEAEFAFHRRLTPPNTKSPPQRRADRGGRQSLAYPSRASAFASASERSKACGGGGGGGLGPAAYTRRVARARA
jgi:hypothetical protein